MERHRRMSILLLLVFVLVLLGARAVYGQRAVARETAAATARHQAAESRELRVIVSLARRRLVAVRDSADTLLAAPVAVGSGRRLRYAGRAWSFVTPPGIHTVIAKHVDPVWIRPDWGYIEVARAHHLRLDSVSARRPRDLPDGGTLIMRDGVAGVLRDSVFLPLPVAEEIVFDGVLYMPPIGSRNRAVPEVLGKFRLDLGNGIGIHGTLDRESIGRAATHGCLRLGDADLAWLFENVGIGTRVYIY